MLFKYLAIGLMIALDKSHELQNKHIPRHPVQNGNDFFQLREVVGNDMFFSRQKIVSKVLSYIKLHNLHDSGDKKCSLINADSKLKRLFGKKRYSYKNIKSVVKWYTIQP